MNRNGRIRAWALFAALLAVLAALAGALTAMHPAGAAGPTSAPATQPAVKWAFAAIADNRRADERPAGTYEAVLRQIRDQTVNPDPKFPPIEFVAAAGDVCTSADDHLNWKLWLATFKDPASRPCFFPAIGNWDDGDVEFNRKVILPAQRNVVGADPHNYHVDWRNVRLIVSGRVEYVESAIVSAPSAIEHVFVMDHYPIFPRKSHQEEFSRERAGKLWNMLLKHKRLVRTFLCGHTHNYYRMRVADPLGKAADGASLPDEEGGIYQVDCGNAGRASHGDDCATIVQIMIDGKDVHFRAVQAPHRSPSDFRLTDQWKLSGN